LAKFFDQLANLLAISCQIPEGPGVKSVLSQSLKILSKININEVLYPFVGDAPWLSCCSFSL